MALQVVRNEHDSVLRIQRGPAIGRGEKHRVFVLQHGSAVEREILTGMVGENYVEVLEGLSEGERVVLSGISSVRDLEALEVE